MSDTLTVELVAPERLLYRSEAEMVVVPGVVGDFGAMPQHAPVVSSLRPGLLSVHTDGKVEEFVVLGGFAEVSAERVTVLADAALPRKEWTQKEVERQAGNAEKRGDEDGAKALRELERLVA